MGKDASIHIELHHRFYSNSYPRGNKYKILIYLFCIKICTIFLQFLSKSDVYYTSDDGYYYSKVPTIVTTKIFND